MSINEKTNKEKGSKKRLLMFMCVFFSILTVQLFLIWHTGSFDIYSRSDIDFEGSEFIINKRNESLDILFSAVEDIKNGMTELCEERLVEFEKNIGDDIFYCISVSNGGTEKPIVYKNSELSKKSEFILGNGIYYAVDIKNGEVSAEHYPNINYYNWTADLFEKENYAKYDIDGGYDVIYGDDAVSIRCGEPIDENRKLDVQFFDSSGRFHNYRLITQNGKYTVEALQPVKKGQIELKYHDENGKEYTLSDSDIISEKITETENISKDKKQISENIYCSIYIKFNPERLAIMKGQWQDMKSLESAVLFAFVLSLLAVILCEIMLVSDTLKNDFSERTADSMPGEAMIFAAVVILYISGSFVLNTAYYHYSWIPKFTWYDFIGIWLNIAQNNTLSILLSSTAAALTAIIGTNILLSLVRTLRNKRYSRFFIARLCKAASSLDIGIRIKASVFIGIFVYTAAVFFLQDIFDGNFDLSSITAFFMCVAAFAAALGIIGDFKNTNKALEEISRGNTSYKTEKPTSIFFKAIFKSINSIGDGFELAYNEKIKSERLKTELITNISHDLKTPLTSIMNYSSLLCDTELEPPEAKDYAKIIYEKSCRLKNITSDLFDISKVQSGNDDIKKEVIDICLLMEQTLGELNEGIEASGLEFVKAYERDSISILADGKKISRVFENLIINCIKYSLKGTRVYISISCEDGHAVTVIKNISSYPMNFNDEEITERFVRGDLSRSTEGSGLGLAIAKSFTQACGGRLNIMTDGDLFKAEIIFEEIEK